MPHRAVQGVRVFKVRCANCVGVVVSKSGVSIPLASGDWYNIHETDLVHWMRQGRVFEFETAQDLLYVQEKHNL
jgi:hypothetical protein